MSVKIKRTGKLAKVLIIVGPTASGKTALSLLLAKKFNGEIISADSRQIYRRMDIGTAKATASEQNGVKHYLVDIRNPDQNYSAGQFKQDAASAIKQISKKGKLPIVVGGTGLYVLALTDNLNFPKVKEDKQLRARIEREIKQKGLDHVFAKLIKLDPEAAYVVDSHNPRRVVRALEVAMLTGQPFTNQRQKSKPLYDFLILGVNKPPQLLKQRIAQRIEAMYRNGLVDEVKKLVADYGYQAQPFDAIGYREVIAYLQGQISLEESIEQMRKNTWRYARRQLTWFRKDKNIFWVSNLLETKRIVQDFIKDPL